MNTLSGYSKSTLSDLYSLTAAGGHFPIHSGRNNEANKLVRTDANGYLNAGWINTTSGAFTGTPSRIYASNDAYIRYMTPANFFPTLTNTSNLLDITIGGLNRKLTIDYSKVSGSTKTLDYKSLPSTTSNASNTVWCSFARITFNTGAWVAANGYIFLGDVESYGYSGILYYEFRSSSTATAISKASLLWLVKNKDTASIIAVKVEDNIYDLYINNYGTYSCPIIYHMSSTISRFTWNVGSWTTTKPTAAYTASDTGRVNYANSANSATQVIVNLHTSNNTEYPLVWSNSASTSTTTGNLLYKSYSHLTYNPSAHRISTGLYIANNSSGPHFTAKSTTGNWAYLRLNNGSTYWDIATRSDSGSGGLWLARLSGNDNGIFVSTGNSVGISTSSPSYKLHVAGDTYTTGWSRAASGFYVHDKGVHFSNNGSNKFGEIACTSGNEFMWGSSTKDLYFNYRAASRGTTVTKFVWNAGSSTTYAAHTLGELVSKNDQTLYGLTSTCNKANDASYTKAAMLIREYNFGGAQTDSWGIAPRLSWHWSGRVQTQIGLGSDGNLYLSKDNFTNPYLLLHLGNSSISNYNVKIGGTTKLFVRDWCDASDMNAVARGGRSSMGMASLSTPSGGTATAVNPNGQTSWHHFINLSFSDGGGGSNAWVTQIANKAGSTDLWVRSRSGGTISDTANWTAGWTRILTGTNYNDALPVKLINDPGKTTLINSYGLNANYGSSSYGHPNEEYLKAFSKYLLAKAAGYTCVGYINPSSRGSYICDVYNNGTNSTTNLPEHITGHYFQHGGAHYHFGTSYGAWYYYTALHSGNYTTYTVTKTGSGASGTWSINITGNAATATSATKSGSSDWLNTNTKLEYGASGLNYFNFNGTAKNDKSNCSPEDGYYHILRMNHANKGGYLVDIAAPLNNVNGIYWRQIRNGVFYGWYKLIDDHNYSSFLDSRYVNVSGDTMTGDLKFGTAPTTTGSTAAANTRLPSHIYRNVYDTSGNVYDHYYNTEYKASTNSYANLRVKSGSTFKTFSFGGDGRFTWDGNTVWHAGNDGSGSGLDADTVDGLHVSKAGNTKPWGTIVSIGTDGVSEMGRFIDFHYDNTTGSDYSTRLLCSSTNNIYLNLPSVSGTLALKHELDGYVKKSGDWMTGTLNFNDNIGLFGQMAGGTDHWEIKGSGTSDNGRLKIQVHDNATTDAMDFEFVDWSGDVYRPLTMTGLGAEIIAKPTPGSWISGKTESSIKYQNLTAIDSNSFWKFYNMKSLSGNVVCYGGLGNTIGFYGYYAATTANRTDWNFTVNTANGNWTASASLYAAHFYENSDEQLKTNIQEILNSDKMPIIKEFDWKEDNSHSYGLIAQELEEQGYSELVSIKDNGYKTVNYSAALSLIVGKLQVKIKELEKEIENLKNKN